MQGTEPVPESRAGEFDLFAFLLLLRSHLLRTALFGLAGFLLMVAFTLTAKPRFTSTTTILIPQKSPSSVALALQSVGGTGLDLLGGGYEVYLDILKSRTVAEALNARFQLREHYHTKDNAGTALVLAQHTAMAASKEGLLTVTVDDEDPRLAADLANAYFVELDHLNQRLAITSAGQQRVYYEQQMVAEKNALGDSEVAQQQAQEKTGLIVPEAQAQAALTDIEQTRAQIRIRQVQLGALLQGETAQNPEVIRLRSEIGGLEGQLHAMQSGGSNSAGPPVARVPAESLTLIRAQREVKFHEALFSMLQRQYENAKQDEAKNVSMVEILDKAIPAEHKSWPPRTLYCLIGLITGIFFGVFYTVMEAFVRAILGNTRNRALYGSLVAGGKSTVPSGPAR